MTDDRVERLTERQREVLRLVAKGFGSKEIGRRLGLSHHSVDRRAERAMHRLGVENRYSAARMVIDAEGGTYDPLTCVPSPLSRPANSATLPGSDNKQERSGTVPASEDAFTPRHRAGLPWPFPTRHADRAVLGRKHRLAWALVGIPCVLMIAWGLLLAGIGALDTLRV